MRACVQASVPENERACVRVGMRVPEHACACVLAGLRVCLYPCSLDDAGAGHEPVCTHPNTHRWAHAEQARGEYRGVCLRDKVRERGSEGARERGRVCVWGAGGATNRQTERLGPTASDQLSQTGRPAGRQTEEQKDRGKERNVEGWAKQEGVRAKKEGVWAKNEKLGKECILWAKSGLSWARKI